MSTPTKLHQLRAERDQLRAAVRDADLRLQELSHAIQHLEARNEALEVDGFKLPWAEAQHLAELRGDLQACTQQTEGLRERLRPLVQIVARCEEVHR